jgi:hypothetical protein
MKRVVALIIFSILTSHFVLATQTTLQSEKTARNKNLSLEYTKKMGFKEGQVINMEIVDKSTMKVYVNECSFCGAFRNPHQRNDIARKTFEWFLNKSGYKKGTVEWYNSINKKIMSISGTLSDSEITLGSSCSIK